ncbi:MAG: HAD family hydrolase [Chloroflexota bacterium]|nr:HAD family hydrolase [Chloroflexota bacterium]
MIQALIFDFDGLILDTEMSSFLTWQEIYEEHDCELPFSTWAICIGGSAELFDPFEYLEQQIGRPVLREEIRLRRRLRHVQIVEEQPVLPGVEDYMLSAKRLGLKIGLASSSRHEWVDSHLTRLGLIDYFDSIKCFDDVKQSKPDPELYLAVLDALGVHGHEAIALEDSPNGVIAAQQAGIYCVAVPNPVTRQLPLEHADLCLSSLGDVSLEQLLEKVQQRAKS